jgi:hypothetical protein
MTMTKTTFAALLLLVGTAASVGAQTKVYPYPGDQTWQPWTQVGGTAEITGTNPDQYGGNGSLELHTAGSLSDWGFYTHYADGGSFWGYLEDVNTLQFDWYREATSVSSSYGSPWLAQTPVLRLLLREDLGSQQFAYSELVWEKYYTDASPATLNAWQTVDMFAGNGQNFWYHTLDPNEYSSGTCGEFVPPGDLGPPKNLTVYPATLGTWSSSCGLSGLEVYGVALGVGSYWPEAYNGYVDYLELGFAEQDGPAVYADFELPPTVVPEPGTILLVGTGLLGLGAASWRSRRRRGQE